MMLYGNRVIFVHYVFEVFKADDTGKVTTVMDLLLNARYAPMR